MRTLLLLLAVTGEPARSGGCARTSTAIRAARTRTWGTWPADDGLPPRGSPRAPGHDDRPMIPELQRLAGQIRVRANLVEAARTQHAAQLTVQEHLLRAVSRVVLAVADDVIRRLQPAARHVV